VRIPGFVEDIRVAAGQVRDDQIGSINLAVNPFQYILFVKYLLINALGTNP
jgi:hypothetical protein